MNKKMNMAIPSDLCGQRGCFSYRDGHCDCLCDTDFNGRRCPFFKSVKQHEDELRRDPELQRKVPEDDFLEANADFMEELAAMEAEADRIAKDGFLEDVSSDDDGWDDADDPDDEGGDGDAY